MKPQTIVFIIGVGLIAVGFLLLPWLMLGSGMNALQLLNIGGNNVTLWLLPAAVIIGLILLWYKPRYAGLAGLLCLIPLITSYSNVASSGFNLIGIGFWAALIGAVLMVVSSAMSWQSQPAV